MSGKRVEANSGRARSWLVGGGGTAEITEAMTSSIARDRQTGRRHRGPLKPIISVARDEI